MTILTLKNATFNSFGYVENYMNALRTTLLMALMTTLLVIAGGAIGGRNGMAYGPRS